MKMRLAECLGAMRAHDALGGRGVLARPEGRGRHVVVQRGAAAEGGARLVDVGSADAAAPSFGYTTLQATMRYIEAHRKGRKLATASS